ncbi:MULTISPECIES: HD-GYP domain-containing protein [Ralstonia solanacearum species complex]|uniref:Metal-dependent phosphohydrolase harboring a hd domain protein n=2 Tax=Ralstonia solanacearum TaxID=305 RepID=A0ABF7RAN8_RALSL|nr:HD-GYP domain-containing protein [Ralstonia solanacearum]ALF88984.1 Cyclic di-GMP phosphodiesterase response regulator RpfG [Ralstonia solanacearum]ATI28386.1 HD-GYP domain-containing protein [Ralstonia solanacearum]EAP74361.1 sensory transduction protein [Ralstonia solanacearum UW551]KEI34091.1 phosphohydrolase [Ralstonia solanacearum]KFX82231.1 phosphohydrolase [Ralstonia solanacearum]
MKRIDANQLRVGMFVMKLGGSWLKHPFWRSQFQLSSQGQVDDIHKAGITEIWIDPERGEDVLAPALMPASADPVPVPEPLTQETLAARPPVTPTSLKEEWKHALQLVQAGKATLGQLFSEARMGRALQTDKALLLVDNVSNSLARNSYALIALARLKNKDDYTYLHSFAVCALMVALARTLGLPEDEIRECGLGGLVHDIGKSAMPRTLLDKSTALTKEELALLQTHAVGGHHLMMGTGQFGEIPREVCLHHHERIDGSGYPDAQKGDEISLWAKMGAICDVYDTLTSSSPYHHAWSPAQALKYMMARTDTQFDRTVFQAFTRSVGIYPVGTLVKLRTNRLGVVVHQNESSVMRPDVVVFYSGNTKTRVRPERISLGRSDDAIITVEEASTWGLSDEEVTDMCLV